jgi:Putative beta-barrel porin 2
MKKIIASASLAALGAANLHAAYAPELSAQERSKPWTISAALRGFYDDNYTTSYKTLKRDSYGVEVSPSVGVNIVLDQTVIGFSYDYTMRWYEDREEDSADHTHVVNLKLNHAFNERFKVKVSDRFVVAQEAEVIDSSGTISTPLRTDGNNIRNTGEVGLTAMVTEVVGLDLSYKNSIYNYEDSGAGSRSALLDRMEHLGTIAVRWVVVPNTAALFGYMYGSIGHTSDDSLDQNTAIGAPFIDPGVRDANSHTVFVGVDHTFTTQFSADIRLGAKFTDYPDALPGSDDSVTSPYLDASATYTYNPGSYLQLGARYDRNQTDIAFQTSSLPTLDQESLSLYAVVNHRITPRLNGSLLGQYQHSEFNGGVADGDVDHLFLVGVNLSYQVNPFLSAEAGYNLDRLDSDVPIRSFTRNRFYVGLRAAY